MRLAIVVPRYGEEILGGAETFARELAERLPRQEFDVEVLTTCADDLVSWRNVFPAGKMQVHGIPVYRFPIAHHLRDKKRYWELMIKFTNRWPTTVDEEYAWIAQSAHSPELYAYIARHGTSYDLLLFVPYLFGMTFYGTSLYPERSVLWPCLHDEPFARFLQTRLMMQECRGIMFTSEPERQLAEGKLSIQNPGSTIVGFGLDPYTADPERFRQKFGLSDPFILYSGRLDSMKNLLQLLNFFIAYKEQCPRQLQLVLMGKGPLPIPNRPDIIQIGFQTGQTKLDACAAATLLCQPSLMESFSIVIMEAWLAGVPVLVHGDCDVTRYHVLRSNGGLYFADFQQFQGAVDWLLDHPLKRRRMGEFGRAYVRREYNWDTVLARFRDAVQLWQRL